MNKYKQSIYIILISLLLSAIRYIIIKDDYTLLKISKVKSESKEIENYEILELKNYINNLSYPEMISIDIAKKIHENNLATFIDARSEDEYLEEHIKDAISLPYELIDEIEKSYDLIWMNELDEDYTYTIENLNKELFIGINDENKFLRNPEKYDSSHEIMLFETVFVIYCSGEGCSLSEDLAFYMYDNLKFKKILIYEGGMPEWIENELPIE